MLGDSDEVVITVSRALPFTLVDERVPYDDDVVAIDTLSVVFSVEDEVADSGGAVLVAIAVTDVLILISV